MDTRDQKITQEQLDKMTISTLKRRFHTARTQARFRGHEWHIPQQVYIDMWLKDDRWLRSGHGADCLVFSRIDMAEEWTPDNVHIITRREMLDNEGRHRNIKSGKAAVRERKNQKK